MENKKIHIALAADSNYIIPVTAVLQSLFDNNEGENISIYLLYLENTLREADLEFLANFTRQRKGTFNGLQIRQEQIEGFPETRHGKSALLRLCLPNLLSNLDKVLYLDGDIIVNDSVLPLFNLDISNYYIAAAKDSASAYNINYQVSMGIEKAHAYYNSGVLLLNLKALREIDLVTLMNEFVQKNSKLIGAPDQDFLNYISQKKTLYIPPKYNMNYLLEKDIAAKIWSKEEIKEAKKSPVIVHYIGPVKPWSILSTHPQRKLWWRYIKKTCFANYRPKDATLQNYLYRSYLLLTQPIERKFSLSAKQKIGKLIPSALKKRFKRSLQKNI